MMKIKLSELRQIVKSIINEQAAAQPSPAAQAMTAELAKMKNVPVRWYNEEANTSQYGVMMVKDIFPMANKIKIVGRFESFDKDSEIFYECGESNFTYMQYPLYNKKYVEKLKSLVCTKSAGGTDVINIGDYSSTTSNAPVNVAESKRKLTNVIKQVVREQSGLHFAAAAEQLKGKQIRLYKDEANTNEYGVRKILKVIPKDGSVEIYFEFFEEPFLYKCQNSMEYKGKFSNPVGSVNYFYNKALIEDLKSDFCIKNASGKPVINIGKYSSTTSNAPVNVAESKKKKVFKEQIQIPGYAGGMTQVDIPDGMLDKYAPSISIDKLPAILGKIQPCLEQAAVRDINDFIQNYPNTFGLILKTIGSKTIPGISEMGMVASEIMGGGFDFSKLTPLLTCILSKVK